MPDVIISSENLGKRYRLRTQSDGRYTALRDVVAEAAARPFRALGSKVGIRKSENGSSLSDLPTSSPSRSSKEDFWALKDVSFEVKQGEVLGIIGRNGAGKSTLLKILSRITDPTEGRVRIKGRVASLLEVGTGFHPELTGRENIYLNGAILGMHRHEIKAKFDEIVAFAEVERFLDTPVKRYSSGMYVRLAFGVAAHLEPEILIVDEVLAVGDAEFQKKCLGKMQDVSKGGRTVLFVSHNMAAIEALCTSAILLSYGQISARGMTQSTIQAYLASFAHNSVVPLARRHDREGSGLFRFTSLKLMNSRGEDVSVLQCGAAAILVLGYENRSDSELRGLHVSLGLDNEVGQRLLLLDSTLVGDDIESLEPGRGIIRVEIAKLPLLPGRYDITLFSRIGSGITDWLRKAAFVDVEAGDFFGTGQLPPRGQGCFVTEHRFICDQPKTKTLSFKG